MSIAVKAYLKFANNDEEVRRFSIDSDASTSYDYLVERVRTVYPSLKREKIQLFWKDEDDELITFSSDEELIEALTHIQGSFFRVYVKALKSSDRDFAESEGQVHPHVSCDGCEGKVAGSRFKCVVCPDYDLCSHCESKGLHSHHHMIRIRNPATTPPAFPPWFMGAPWMRCRPMGPRGSGARRGGPWHGLFHGGRGGRCGGPWSRRGHDPEEGPIPRGGSSPSDTSQRGQTGQKGQQGQQGQAGEEGQYRQGDEPAFFHQFGEVLNTFLGPFGVDVHTYVDDKQGQPGQCGQHKDDSYCPSSSSTAEAESETANTENGDSKEEPMEEASCAHDGDHTYVVVDKTQDGGKSRESDSALADAIAHMKAMGFNDDGGWLTQLLKQKNYDINKVLDAIPYPNNKQ